MSRETHIPAKQTEACPYPRVPQPHVNQERTQGSREPSRQGSQAAVSQLGRPIDIRRLRVRREFLRAAKGRFLRRHLVVVQVVDRRDSSDHVGEGFTTTRKIGNAVIRNRARRRLREISRALLPRYAQPGHDYVFIARAGTATAPWQRLLDDTETALIRLLPDSSTDPGGT